MFTKRASLSALLFILLGFVVSSFWHSLHNPIQPMYIELFNETEEVIPSIEIEHGGNALQEKIMVLRLKPNESRLLVLNHKPGMGFNIAVNYTNAEKTEICTGKNKDYWYLKETITKFGIYTTLIR
ncbi:MAG: hypothetical protein V3U71_00500 [Cocleimonas sp.]